MSGLPENPKDLPSPPFLDIPGIANFRDIGGYACSGTPEHASVRTGLVFRAADPSKVTSDGLAKMKQLGIKKVFDLRSVPELRHQGPEWAGVDIDEDVFVTKTEGQEIPADSIERVWCPVFKKEDYSPEQIALRYKEYSKMGPQVR